MKTIYLKGTSASSESDATSALMVTVKRPVGVSPGDLLMAHVRSSPGVRISAPRGWDFVKFGHSSGRPGPLLHPNRVERGAGEIFVEPHAQGLHRGG